MRVFISINFTNEVKDKINKIIEEMKCQAVKGSFTKEENLHLTLAFIGEVEGTKIADLLCVMDKVAAECNSFTIDMDKLGKFRSGDRYLYWLGIEDNDSLSKLQHMLTGELKKNGFHVDDKPFKPHVTLCRRCRMNRLFDEMTFSQKIPQIKLNVPEINLMLSLQEEQAVSYHVIGSVKLKKY